MDKLKVKAAIFDLDGTLFDSGDVWRRIDDEFLTQRGITPPADYMHAMAAMGAVSGATYTIERFGLTETAEEVIEIWRNMAREEYAHKLPMLDGAKEYLMKTAKNGVRIAALTSLDPELAMLCMKNHGVYDCFERIITTDETGLRKDCSEIYMYATELLGVEPHECVVLDDLAVAVRSAKTAGLKTVGIQNDLSPFSFERQSDAHADFVVPSLSQAPTLVAN